MIGLMGRLYEHLYKTYPELEEASKVVEDMLLTVVDEAETIKACEIAQYLIRRGWDRREVVEATKLDQATVESLYERRGEG